MEGSLDIDPGAGGKGVCAGKICVAGLEGFFRGDHDEEGLRLKAEE
jgi:hypothetical protein